MSELQYWLTLTAASIAISAFITLYGVRDMLHHRSPFARTVYLTIWFAFIVLGLYESARQQEASAKQEAEITSLRQTITDLQQSNQHQAAPRLSISPQLGSDVIPSRNGTRLAPGEGFRIRVGLKNAGPTPAIDLTEVRRVDFIPITTDSPITAPPETYLAYDQTRRTAPITLARDGSIDHDTVIPPLNKATFQQLQTTQVRVFFHGRLEYRDIFGKPHWQRYCGYLLPSGLLAICPAYNDMDNN